MVLDVNINNTPNTGSGSTSINPIDLFVDVRDRYDNPLNNAQIYYSVELEEDPIYIQTRAGVDPVITVSSTVDNGVYTPQGFVQIRYRNELVGTYDISTLAERQEDGSWSLLIRTEEGTQRTTFPGRREIVRMGKTVVVLWDSPKGSPYFSAFQVSAAATPEELFTDTALTQTVDMTHRSYEFSNYLASGYFAVRLLYQQDAVPYTYIDTYSAGATASSGELEISSETIEPGESFSVLFRPDNTNEGSATWGVSNGTEVVTGNYSATYVASDPSTTVDISFEEDGETITDSVVTTTDTPEPDAATNPQGLSITQGGDGNTVYISWDQLYLGHTPADSYHIYMGQNQSGLLSNPPIHTEDTHIVLNNLIEDDTYYILVRGVTAEGVESDLPVSSATSFIPVTEAKLTGALRIKELPNIDLIPGTDTELDLSEYYYAGTGTEWTDGTITVDTLVLGNNLTVSLADEALTLDLSNEAVVGDDPAIVILRITNGSRVPIWGAMIVRASTSAAQYVSNITGYHIDSPVSDVIIPNISGSVSGLIHASWSEDIYNAVQILGKRSDYTAANNEFVLTTSISERSGKPAVFIGYSSSEDKYMVVMFNTDPLPSSYGQLPILPDTPTSYETGETWTSFVASTLFSSPNSLIGWAWRRVIVGGSDLYDINYTQYPTAVYYDSPNHYNGVWFDQDLYPSDARFKLVSNIDTLQQDGYVEYRNELVSATSSPTLPTVSSVVISVTHETVHASWQTLFAGVRVYVSVPVVLTNVNTGYTTTIFGEDEALFSDLQPNTDYTVTIAGNAAVPVTTLRRPINGVAAAQYVEEGLYRYTLSIDIEDTYIDATAPNGSIIEDEEIIFESESVYETLPVVVRYTPEDVYTHYIPVTWNAPPEGTSFVRELVLGRETELTEYDPPIFSSVIYTKPETYTIPGEIYGAGTYSLTPLVSLPHSASNYTEVVTSSFVDPAGNKYPDTITIDEPTELTLEATVYPLDDGSTPTIVGFIITPEISV